MNPAITKITNQPCVVCGYPFADAHHLYPQYRSRGFGAKKSGKETIALCPNHHRFANIVQMMVERCLQVGAGYEEVTAFANEFFDPAFIAILDDLIHAHETGEKLLANELYNDDLEVA